MLSFFVKVTKKSKLVPGLQSEQRQLGDIASKLFHDILFVITMFPTT